MSQSSELQLVLEPSEPPFLPFPGRTSPAVMQPPLGMPLPPADIGPPPYEPPGHPVSQPGFIPPHVSSDGTYMPPGELGRELRGSSGQLPSSLHYGSWSPVMDCGHGRKW
jgi:hypothetical protein